MNLTFEERAKASKRTYEKMRSIDKRSLKSKFQVQSKVANSRKSMFSNKSKNSILNQVKQEEESIKEDLSQFERMQSSACVNSEMTK